MTIIVKDDPKLNFRFQGFGSFHLNLWIVISLKSVASNEVVCILAGLEKQQSYWLQCSTKAESDFNSFSIAHPLLVSAGDSESKYGITIIRIRIAVADRRRTAARFRIHSQWRRKSTNWKASEAVNENVRRKPTDGFTSSDWIVALLQSLTKDWPLPHAPGNHLEALSE